MRLTSFTAATVAVMAGSALLVQAPGASSADPTRSSAYGVSVKAGGKQAVPPTPTVESTDGSTKTAGGPGAFPAPAAPLLSGDVLALTAGDDKASVEVTDLAIGNVGGQIPPELKPLTDQLEQLQQACLDFEAPEAPLPDLGGLPIPVPQPSPEDFRAFCGLLDDDFASLATLETLRVACNGDSGTVTVLGASLLGVGVPTNLENVKPDTKLFPKNPLLDITLNRQTPGPRGAFTVDGLVISLGEGQAEAVVGSTTCGEGIPQAAGRNTEAPTAPAPVPQQGSAPVTG